MNFGKENIPHRGSLSEQALPNSNKINESKSKENTGNLVFYERKEERRRKKINLIYTLNSIIMGPCGGAGSTFLLTEGMQRLVLSQVAGFAFGIIDFSK